MSESLEADSDLPVDPYVDFTREEWSRLRASTPLSLSETDVASLRGQDEPMPTASLIKLAILAEAYTRLGNQGLADDAKRVLQQNDPDHPWLSGGWPKDPSIFHRLNPFARERRSVSRPQD